MHARAWNWSDRRWPAWLVARLLLLNRMVTALERHVIAADNLH
jgi:hypothetical protein